MANVFDSIRLKKPQQNLFGLSFRNLLTANMGKVTPILCKPVIPGDTFKVSTEIFVRLSPMEFPILDNLDIRCEAFYCPDRILCNDENEWTRFISPSMKNSVSDGSVVTESMPETTPPSFICSPMDSISFPTLDNSHFKDGELLDLLGYHMIPASVRNYWPLSLLPINMYNKVWYEYYQDQNLYNFLSDNTDYPILGKVGGYGPNNDWKSVFKEKLADGVTDAELLDFSKGYFKLKNRAWKKDYFTSALPWTQRGADVHLPLYVGNASVTTPTGNWDVSDVNGKGAKVFGTGSPGTNVSSIYMFGADGYSIGSGYDDNILQRVPGNSVLSVGTPTSPSAYKNIVFSSSSQIGSLHEISSDALRQLQVKFDNINSTTINELRRATALQKYLEISARVGSRYKEFVYGHFGVNIPDSRLQRPEYLGGWKIPIKINEVLQTSSTTSDSLLGDMAGHGIAYGSHQGFYRSFDEHGYIMILMTIMPKASYFQGIPKDLWKMDRLDWYNPEFAHIGEQEIKQIELYCNDSNAGTLDETFGYTPRYAEYKTYLDEVHGTFRSSLVNWHLARKFDSAPYLTNDFMYVDESKDGLNRIFPVMDGVEHFYVAVQHHIRALRSMPYFGTPML